MNSCFKEIFNNQIEINGNIDCFIIISEFVYNYYFSKKSLGNAILNKFGNNNVIKEELLDYVKYYNVEESNKNKIQSEEDKESINNINNHVFNTIRDVDSFKTKDDKPIILFDPSMIKDRIKDREAYKVIFQKINFYNFNL